MTTAKRWVRQRRGWVFCAAAVLVHYLAAGWINAQGGAPPAPPAPPALRPALVFAELQAAPAPPVISQHLAPPAQPSAEPSAAVPVRQVQSAIPSPQRERVAASAGSSVKADLAPPAELTFDVLRTTGGAPEAHGEAVLDWQRTDTGYQLNYSAALTEPVPEHLVSMASEGRIGTAGIAPRGMTEQRRGRARTATHFDEQGTITFSAAQRPVPMQPGAQDKATWPMQLSAIARADPGQLAAGVAFAVGEEKQAGVYRFVMLGQEQLDTAMGTLATWHLARVAAPGSYQARLDIWLAPGYAWYPVQLRTTEANGTVTTQTIRKIAVKQAGN